MEKDPCEGPFLFGALCMAAHSGDQIMRTYGSTRFTTRFVPKQAVTAHNAGSSGVPGFLSLGKCSSHTSKWPVGMGFKCGTHTTMSCPNFFLNVWAQSPQVENGDNSLSSCARLPMLMSLLFAR